MVYREHYVELFINGKAVELESQESLNLRFQNVLFDPERVSSTQAEYSFEFEIPSTPGNDRIFGYANNLSKTGKFRTRWDAEVYADGDVIFRGTLTLNSYKGRRYRVNLVSVKNSSLQEIFGDDVMYDISGRNEEAGWYVPFNGAGDGEHTINSYNAAGGGVMFPLVCYGAFQKSPKDATDDIREYTSKFKIDKYNRWYVESFYPSLNVMDTLRKAFEYKGYTAVGDAFRDGYLNEIYMSANLADGQVPAYNLGNPKFGSVSLQASITTSGSTAYQQELNFPYYKVYGNVQEGDSLESRTEYNLESVELYDILGNGQVTVASPSYMYQPDEKVIVIPESGFYKVEMRVSSRLDTTGSITVGQHLYDPLDRTMTRGEVQLPVGFWENTPIEVALVRNYEDSYELIKGKHNRNYVNGNPNVDTYTINNTTYPNVNEWITCFPHEDPYNSTLPTEQNDLALYNTQGRRNNYGAVSQHVGNTRGAVAGHEPYDRGGGSGRHVTSDGRVESERYWTPADLGYVYRDGEIMAYDQVVSPSFICGVSSFYGGVPSVMKNGYSWSKSNSSENQIFAPVMGYQFMSREAGTGNILFRDSRHNDNGYINTPISYANSTDASLVGFISCMVWLEKNDVLELMAVHRGYTTTGETNVHYQTTTDVSLSISAASPRSYAELKAARYTYYTPSEFDTKLRLSNFLSNETRVSDWVQNVVDAFNLDMVVEGTTVRFDTKKKFDRYLGSAVDIDDRVNSGEAEASRIEYPRSMSVRYRIDADEWGAEKSVVDRYGSGYMNRDDWKDFIDSGYTVIQLNDDSYVTSTSDKSLQFSYTWYDNFTWYDVNSSFEQDDDSTMNLRIPVISKYTYMIDGYDYDESMKHDGYSLAQRFWFRPVSKGASLYTRTYPTERIQVYTPVNAYQDVNLSYKDTEKSLLTRYFNITPYLSSNYVTVEVYLSADEYNRIRNGAFVKFDSDLYIPVEVEGYDPTGYNPTTLKLMKKVV